MSPTTSSKYARPSSCESGMPSARISGLFGSHTMPPESPVEPPTRACFSITSGSIPESSAASAAAMPPPPLPAMSRSTERSHWVLIAPPRRSEVNPRSTIGTSIVVLVFWIAGTRRLVRQAGEEAIDDAFEVRDQSLDLVGQPHVLEALACRPFCCRGRLEKSCAGIGGQRGSSGAIGSGGVGFPGERSGGKRVSDQISNRVSSGPSGRIRYDEALL